VRRWPNLFIVGTARAGTTSLWHYLRGHPEIYMSPLKEPHYFSDRPPKYMRTVATEPDYLALFAAARGERFLGEASPHYLHGTRAAAAIKAVSPDARAVAVLREPVSRLYSSYWHSVRYGREQRGVEEALVEPVATDPAALPSLRYFSRSFYARALGTFSEAFGDDLLVLWYDDLARDVRGFVRRILDFLAVEPAYAESFDATPRNTSSLPRSRTVAKLYAAPRIRNAGAKVIPRKMQSRAESLLLERRSVPELDPAFRRVLEPVFADDRAELERILGRPAPWGSLGG